MRISLVLLLCLVIVVVNSATTKAPAQKSAYAFLRSVRGKSSCASGTCPYWEQHGRSFVSLRCYAEEYKECTCLHRMCFSSCMFTRKVCNEEMVSCLQQICPRCLPVSAQSMCKIYDSMATKVAESLSTFACYPCCPNLNNSPNNGTSTRSAITITTARPGGNVGIQSGTNSITGTLNRPNGVPQNGGAGPNNGGAGSNNGGAGTNNGGARPNNVGAGNNNVGAGPNNGGAGTNNVGARPNNVGASPNNGGAGNNNGGAGSNNGGAGTNNGGARPNNVGAGPNNGGASTNNGGTGSNSGGNNGNNNNFPGVFPGSGLTNNNRVIPNQRVQKTVPTTRRALTTTRQTATARTSVPAQKKPQTNNLIKN